MIVGIGVDICAVPRLAAALQRHPGLAAKLFTPAELAQTGDDEARLAGRFAAKEALAKALGAPDGLAWQDCQIGNDDAGLPNFELSGTVARAAERLGAQRIWLSISHEQDTAVALVVCESC